MKVSVPLLKASSTTIFLTDLQEAKHIAFILHMPPQFPSEISLFLPHSHTAAEQLQGLAPTLAKF